MKDQLTPKPNKLELWTDRIPMGGTILVGIATTVYLAINIMPDVWSKAVMAIFCGALPLISARFLIKKRMAFFWMTVCLIVFSDVSMVLSLTETQSHALVTAKSDETPPALKRLQDATDKAQATLDDLLAQQAAAKNRVTLDNLNEQIKGDNGAQKALAAAKAAEAAWKDPSAAIADRVNSHDVFMAIPTALASLDLSRYMTIVFALLVAVVYQGTLIASVKATIKAVKRGEGKTRRRRRRINRANVESIKPSEEPLASE